jgi:phosphatidylglycerol:prolipoprotein diacylglycerol transferase
MMVLGFLAAIVLMRRMSRKAGLDPAIMTSAALYSLIVGVVGARIFFVVHRFDQFRGDILGSVAVWRGGLEFLGGVIPAIGFLLFYLHRHKLPIRRYLDIMAVGLMMGLAFGRIGCFLNGDCFGKPTDLPWGIRFPYRSFVYLSQINPDPGRGRTDPHLKLPRAEYFSFSGENGKWCPKPLEELTQQQQYEVTKGKYRCRPVHPSQLYAWANALLLCAILYVFWRRSSGAPSSGEPRRRTWRSGSTVGLALVLYGVSRFLLEFVRDDNPFEFAFLTISQIIGVVILVLGVALLAVLMTMKPDEPLQEMPPPTPRS